MKKNLFKKNKLLMSWTLSYVAIFILQIVMSIFVYTQSMNNVMKQIKQKNEVVVARMQERVDTRIEAMEKLMLQIAQNSDVAELLKHKTADEIAYNTKSKVHQLFRDLKFSSQFIDGIYLYLHEPDMVISNENVIDGNIFYKHFYGEDGSIEEMQDLIKGESIRRVTSLKLIDDLNVKVRHLAYMQSFPWAVSKDKDATLIIVAEESKFFDFQDIKYDFDEPKMFVTEEDFEILISNNEVINAEAFVENNLEALKRAEGEYVNLEGNMVKITDAKEYGLKYFILIDEDSYARDFNVLKLLIIIELIFANIIGIFLCVYLAKRNYMPVKKLVGRFREQFFDADEDMKNEMEYISSVVDRVVEEKNLFEKHISEQNKIMKDYYLRLLLSSKAAGNEEVMENIKNLGITFPEKYFLVVLVRISDHDSLFGMEENITEEEKLNVVKYLIANVLEELFNNVCKCYCAVKENNKLAYIINCDDTLTADKLQDLIAQATRFMRENFAIIFECALSDIHNTVYGLEEAYYEAMIAMDNQRKDQSSTSFEDIVEKKYLYPFTSEEEQRFKNILRNGDFEAAKDSLGMIISGFVKNGCSGEHLQCFKFDILGTFLKIMNIEENNTVIADAMYKLTSAHTPPEIQAVLEGVVKYVCEYMKGADIVRKNNMLSDKIYEFIEKKYNDPDLNVAMIADYFGMSAYYVSLRFKEAYGEPLKSYINRYKIKKSLEFLNDTDMSVVEIASAVGFADSNAFIRVFKRYQTVTPAKYREGKKKN